jgi:hypothetical protein
MISIINTGSTGEEVDKIRIDTDDEGNSILAINEDILSEIDASNIDSPLTLGKLMFELEKRKFLFPEKRLIDAEGNLALNKTYYNYNSNRIYEISRNDEANTLKYYDKGIYVNDLTIDTTSKYNSIPTENLPFNLVSELDRDVSTYNCEHILRRIVEPGYACRINELLVKILFSEENLPTIIQRVDFTNIDMNPTLFKYTENSIEFPTWQVQNSVKNYEDSIIIECMNGILRTFAVNKNILDCRIYKCSVIYKKEIEIS